MLSSAVSSAPNFCRRVSLSSMIWWLSQGEVTSRTLHFHPSTSHRLPNIWWRLCFWPGVSYIKLTGRECLTSLVNVARYYCVMKRDNSNARKKLDKFEFLRDKPTGNMAHLSDDAPQPTPGVLYIDVTRSGLSKWQCTLLGRSYGHLMN